MTGRRKNLQGDDWQIDEGGTWTYVLYVMDEGFRFRMSGPPTGGVWNASVGQAGFGSSDQTSDLAYNISAANLELALERLAIVGTDMVVCSGGPLPGTPIDAVFDERLRSTIGDKGVSVGQGTLASFAGAVGVINRPLDFTGYTAASFAIKDSEAAAANRLELTLGAGVTLGGTAGTVSVVITAAQAAALDVTTLTSPLYYDLRVTDAAARVYPLRYGYLDFRQWGS